MVELIKQIVKRTPLAGPLRSFKSYLELQRLPDDEYRTERDDRAMAALMHEGLRADSVCIDVGANTGRVLSLMLKHAPAGQHYAFEPVPHLADGLRRRFPQITVHAFALSDTEGVATFNYVVNVPGWSGLRQGSYPKPVEIQEILVEVRRLDDVIPVDLPVRFIKIDVEGAELQALRGGLNTIRRCIPMIVFEYGEIHGMPYGTTPEVLYDYLTEECGLDVFSLIGRRPRLSRDNFATICREATASNYARWAQGNFLAR